MPQFLSPFFVRDPALEYRLESRRVRLQPLKAIEDPVKAKIYVQHLSLKACAYIDMIAFKHVATKRSKACTQETCSDAAL